MAKTKFGTFEEWVEMAPDDLQSIVTNLRGIILAAFEERKAALGSKLVN